jgi:signal peptidase II
MHTEGDPELSVGEVDAPDLDTPEAHEEPHPPAEAARDPAPAVVVPSALELTLGDPGELAIPAPPPTPSFPAPSYLSPSYVSPPTPAAPPRALASIRFLVLVTLLSLVADLATKSWAKRRLDGYDPVAHSLRKIDVWKDHLELIFARNPGGAWSFLRSLPDSLRRPFFLVVSAGAIVFIITIYQRVYRDQTAMRWGLPLALGGAMGNLADRIRYGWVVDFIDTSMKWGGREHHWPTFNVADIAIVLGVGLMAIDMLRTRSAHLHVHDDAPTSRPTAAPSV